MTFETAPGSEPQPVLEIEDDTELEQPVERWLRIWMTISVVTVILTAALALVSIVAGSVLFLFSAETILRIPGGAVLIVLLSILGPPSILALMLFEARVLVRRDSSIALGIGGLMMVCGSLLALAATGEPRPAASTASNSWLTLVSGLAIILGAGQLVWGWKAMPVMMDPDFPQMVEAASPETDGPEKFSEASLQATSTATKDSPTV